MPLSVETKPNANFIDGIRATYDELRFASVPRFVIHGLLDDSQITEALVLDVEDLSLEYDLDGIISFGKLNNEGDAIFGKVEPDQDFATTRDKGLSYWDDGFKDTPPVGQGVYNLRIPESAQPVRYDTENGKVIGKLSYLISHMIVSSGGHENAQFYGDFAKEGDYFILPHGEWMINVSCFEFRVQYDNETPDRIAPDTELDRVELFGFNITTQRTTVTINKRTEFKYDRPGVMVVLYRLGF